MSEELQKSMTQNKQAAEALKKSKEFIETTLDSMNDAISVIDVNNFSIIDVNRAFLRIYGLDKKDVMGKTCYEITHKRKEPCTPPDDTCPLLHTLKTGKHSMAEHVHFNSDGEKRYVEVSTSPIFDENGTFGNVIHLARDITDRKAGEEKLRESEGRMKFLVSSNPAVIYTMSISNDFGHTFVSENVVNMLGFGNQEFINDPGFHEAHIHPDDMIGMPEKFQLLLKNGFHSQEYRFLHRDGSYRWLHDEMKLVRDRKGKPIEIIGYMIDITESRWAKEEYRTILNTAMDGFLILNMEGQFLKVNNAYCNILGYSREELLRMRISDVDVLEKPDDTAARIRQIKENGQARFETRQRRKDGRIVDVEISVQYLHIGTGKMFSFLRDITNSKRAGEALRESEERYRRLVDYSPYGIAIHSDDKYVFMNSSGARILGASDPSQLIGKPVLEIIHPDYHKPFIERIRMLEKGKAVPLIEEKFLRIDGTPIDVEIVSIPFKYHDKPSKYSVFQDITERKKNEELRLENARLVLANRAKSEFLSTMSHELRTPMNAVLGFSELLKEKISGELNEKQEHFIDNIISSGRHQLGLIETILEMVQLEAGTLELSIEKVDVPATINEIIGSRETIALARRVVLKKEIDPDLGIIMADRNRFKQIMDNLLDNAIKFSKAGGGTVIVASKKEGGFGKFSVSDTGIGIQEEDLKKLFIAFQQIDTGSSRRYSGTGIGLAVIKQLVEMHGGSFNVESKYGEGSVFTFFLPLEAHKA